MLPVMNSHSAGGCGNQNRLINFDILMLLGHNYEVTIYRNSQRTTATPISNKVSVKILVLQFFSDSFTDKQAIIMSLNKDHCATSHWSEYFMP